jgi:hypothetical protein
MPSGGELPEAAAEVAPLGAGKEVQRLAVVQPKL